MVRLAPSEKSKCLLSGGSVVARLKLFLETEGHHRGVEPAA